MAPLAGRTRHRRHAYYWAATDDDLDHPVTLRLFPDGSADGVGADGARHHRFRAWKESLLGR
ncbi:MAG: hypothetical protein H0W25_18665 [Acidimicrobiia bacterium]|nr:hypothetical protein [Acidimicrobiia bacterium]